MVQEMREIGTITELLIFMCIRLSQLKKINKFIKTEKKLQRFMIKVLQI